MSIGVTREVQVNQVERYLRQATEAYEALLGTENSEKCLGFVEQAEGLLRQISENQLSGTSDTLLRLDAQIQSLRNRARVVERVWELSAENLLQGVEQLRTAIKIHQEDPLLAAMMEQLEKRLKDQSERGAAEYRNQARAALEQGDVNAAVELLRHALELRDTPEIRGEFTHLQRMAVREARLRDLELDYGSKLQSDSKPDALRSLGEILRLLIGPEAELPQEVRRAANELLQLEKRLYRPDAWERAQELLKQISDVGLENSSAARLYGYANRWLELGRFVVLAGVISSSTDLGNLEEAYRAAQIAIKENPRDAELVQRLGALKNLLVSSLDQSARKRLGRAQDLLAQGSYATALENLAEIEDKYGEAESEFEGLLRDHDEAVKIREEARDLGEQAIRLQGIAEKVASSLEQARRAYVEGNVAEADKMLRHVHAEDPHGEAVILNQETEDLQQKIKALREEQEIRSLRDVLNEAEVKLILAEREEDLHHVLNLLARASRRGLTEEDESRRGEMMARAQAALLAFRESQDWQLQAQHLIDRDSYDAAIELLEKARNSVSDPELAVVLAEAKRKRALRLREDKALFDGQSALARKEYDRAERCLAEAFSLGLDVEDLLRAAQAGLFLDTARVKFEAGELGEAELSAQQALRIGQNREPAFEIVREVYRLSNQIVLARIEGLIQEAERASEQLLLLKAEDRLNQAHEIASRLQEEPSLLLTSHVTSALILRVTHYRETIQTARELLRLVAEARTYLMSDSRSEEALHLLSQVLRHPDDNEIVHNIRQRATWLSAGHSMLRGEYEALERLLVERIANVPEGQNARAILRWVSAKRQFDLEWEDRRTTSQCALQEITDQLKMHREEASRDARIWKWASILAAVAAFGLLIYAVGFLVQSREPLTYLSTLPGILTGISIPFIHRFYIRALDQVKDHGAQALAQWKDYEDQENQRKKIMFEAILGDVRELNFDQVESMGA